MEWKGKEPTQNFLGPNNNDIQRNGADGPTVHPTHPNFKREEVDSRAHQPLDVMPVCTPPEVLLCLDSGYSWFCFLHTQVTSSSSDT